jgi:hypothetical protein
LRERLSRYFRKKPGRKKRAGAPAEDGGEK